jgi:riboflavin kinase/FMN adenylyltransferase
MATIRFNWKETPLAECRGAAVAIGNFDGVHRGHGALLSELIDRAHTLDIPAVAMTFDPHPLQLLRPEQFQPVLTTVADRADLIQSLGVDHVLILQTSPELLKLSAEEFFDQVIRSRLAARILVEGVNFGFGRQRQGNIETLRLLCARSGIGLAVVPPFTTSERIVVSSSRVRTALMQGDVRKAADFLGRLYRLRGTVGHGQGRGKTIGFPTANLESIETLVPSDGVYAVCARHQGMPWPGAANIGPNPTFGETARKIEVHLIGFQGDLTGQSIAVDFVEHLRETRPFANVTALVEQLNKDVETARQIIGKSPSGTPGESDSDLRSRVGRILAEEIAPILLMDSAKMELLDITNGVARIRISGSCDSCPSTIMTVIQGMEQELRRRVPEIEYVEIVP